jgi:hypothetical protein
MDRYDSKIIEENIEYLKNDKFELLNIPLGVIRGYLGDKKYKQLLLEIVGDSIK